MDQVRSSLVVIIEMQLHTEIFKSANKNLRYNISKKIIIYLKITLKQAWFTCIQSPHATCELVNLVIEINLLPTTFKNDYFKIRLVQTRIFLLPR